jgi:ABC-2 type transport system permease protein
MLFTFFFSGHMFPLDFLPEPWVTIVEYMPFQYMAYFPAAVFLGKISGPQMWQGLAIQAAWVGFFIVTCRVMLRAGFNRYSGYGG